MNAHGRLNVHHIVFEAGEHDLVVLIALVGKALPGPAAHTVQAVGLDFFGILVNACRDHAAFAGHDIFGHIKAENADVPDGADLSALVLRLNGMGCIFDDQQVMPAGQYP